MTKDELLKRLMTASTGIGCLICFVFSVSAKPLKIDITGGEVIDKPIPMAIASFEWTGQGAGPSVDIAEVITSDLQRSGFYEPIPQQDFISSPTFGGAVRFQTWRTVGADFLVLGRILQQKKSHYILEYELFDVYKGERISGYQIESHQDRLRNASHFIADLIYKDLTGRNGVFNTQMAFVAVKQKDIKTRQYDLVISDADGKNQQVQLSTTQPVMSPSWSPDKRRLAYVSFQNGKPQIFVKDVESNQIQTIASFPGINSAPAWSPDGNSIAFVLSKDGNPEIYVRDLRKTDMLRITFNQAIDTEPTWSPSGRNLVFTSDRGGTPQLYQIDVLGGETTRLTWEGTYNSSPDFSPDGRYLTYIHRDEQGSYRVALKDLDTKQIRFLTEGPLDEAPSFSPNGDMILYASKYMNRMILNSVARNGQGKTSILIDSDYRQPAWAPFNR